MLEFGLNLGLSDLSNFPHSVTLGIITDSITKVMGIRKMFRLGTQEKWGIQEECIDREGAMARWFPMLKTEFPAPILVRVPHLFVTQQQDQASQNVNQVVNLCSEPSSLSIKI